MSADKTFWYEILFKGGEKAMIPDWVYNMIGSDDKAKMVAKYENNIISDQHYINIPEILYIRPIGILE